MIYAIYVYVEIVSLFAEFEKQTNEVSGWYNLSMSLNFLESMAFAWRAFFSYFLVFGMVIGYLLLKA